MQPLRPILCAVALAILTAGCASDPPPPSPARDVAPAPASEDTVLASPELLVDRTTYAPGDSLALLFRPQTDVGYNLCGNPERFEAGTWTLHQGEVLYMSDALREANVEIICNSILHLAQAGDTVRYPIRLSDRMAPGTYRFRTRVERMDGNRQLESDTLTSGSFVVQADTATPGQVE